MSELPDTQPCPQCGQPVPDTDPASNLLQCPHCGNQFFVKRTPAVRTFGAAGEGVAERAQELARARRALIRYRSYFVIAAGGCLIFAGQAVYTVLRTDLTPTGRNFFTAVGVLLLLGGVYFARRALAVTRKLKRPL